jgi:photosystem II stability/assembly factor-like uncharacterized protein
MNLRIAFLQRLAFFSMASWGCCLSCLAGTTASLPLTGEPIGWKDAGLHGGQINAIVVSPHEPGLLFAGSYYGDGLFRSNDSGKSWHPVKGFRNQVVYAISFDPEDQKTLWVVSWMKVFKSVDAGNTWREYDPALESGCVRNYYAIAIDPMDGDAVYVGASGIDGSPDEGRIYRSADGGASWRELSLVADHSVCAIAVSPRNGRELWAVTGPETAAGGSIYQSRDGGETWRQRDTGLAGGWLWCVAVDPHHPQKVFAGGEYGLYCTKNGGETWARLEPQSWCRGFVMDPKDPERLYASWGDREFSASRDGGTTWTTRSVEGQFLSLSIDPHHPEVLFGGEVFGGAYRSDDAGAHWKPFTQGIRANQVFDVLRLSNGTLAAATLSGLYRSDEEKRWERGYAYPALSIAASSVNEAVLYAGVEGGVCRSIDSGRSWEFRALPATDTFLVAALAVSRAQEETLYLGTLSYSGERGDLYASRNGGETVRLLTTFDVPVNAVAAHPENPNTIYAATGAFYAPGTPGGVYRSLDGGAHWRMLRSGKVVNTLVVDPHDPDTLYVGCGESGGRYAGVLKSRDGGITWSEKSYGIPPGSAIMKMGIDPEDHFVVYAATYDRGIYLSRDRGEYWTRLGLPEYWLYEVLAGSAHPTSTWGKERVTSSASGAFVYAGSGSGLLEYTGAGIGTIAGLVSDARSGNGIHGVSLYTDSGGAALSLSGAFVMVVPAGRCTLRGSKAGYESGVLPEVLVTSGADCQADMTMRPLGRLYFPHVAANDEWETRIGIFNTSTTRTVQGDLRGFTCTGTLVGAPLPLTLAPHARRQIAIGSDFGDPSTIRYLVFEPDGDEARGYATFSREGRSRASVPAAGRVSNGDLYLTHIASSQYWWTGVSLLNTTAAPGELLIEFDTGTAKRVTLAPQEQKTFTIEGLLREDEPSRVRSGVIRNPGGVVGMELFGSAEQLSGILLTDETAARQDCPHVAADEGWWTGVVLYNPSPRVCSITIRPYRADGSPLPESPPFVVTGQANRVRLLSELHLPAATTWFQMDGACSISGLELFGTTEGYQLAGLSGVATSAPRGCFFKPETEEWSEIALVNTEATPTTVTLTAYDDGGSALATTQLVLGGHEKRSARAEELVAHARSGTATIEYVADNNVIGFQLSGSSGGNTLDALPGL